MKQTNDAFDIDLSNLTSILKMLKGKGGYVKIGILGGKNARKDGGSNASIGARHEYGLDGMPQRSFLRMPLNNYLNKALESAGAFDEDTLKEVIKKGNTTPWLKKVAVVAEQVVGDAFATGGFGQWIPSNMAHKTVHQTLVETTQLRDSITSEVVSV